MSETNAGHNNPPEVLQLAPETISDISGHMADMPVIENERDAKLMKLHIDRAVACVRDLKAECEGKVRPLDDKVTYIKGLYRRPRRMLGDLLDEMRARLELFVKAEQSRREAIAMQAAADAAAAEQRAREAERIEKERLDDAAKGEIGVNVADIMADADEAFEAYEKAERQAILAQKQTHVKVGGGFSRAIGMRKKETLQITDAFAAISQMGVSDDIREAILKTARTFRKLNGRLPNGISSTVEEHL